MDMLARTTVSTPDPVMGFPREEDDRVQQYGTPSRSSGMVGAESPVRKGRKPVSGGKVKVEPGLEVETSRARGGSSMAEVKAEPGTAISAHGKYSGPR